MRKSTLFIALIATLATLLGGVIVHAKRQEYLAYRRRQDSQTLVRTLGLTDLCLFTEARYTRHPAMADRHAAFQDHPMGLDHFPSGSLMTPPSFPSPDARPHPALPQHP